jgi:hypothetical protein
MAEQTAALRIWGQRLHTAIAQMVGASRATAGGCGKAQSESGPILRLTGRADFCREAGANF